MRHMFLVSVLVLAGLSAAATAATAAPVGRAVDTETIVVDPEASEETSPPPADVATPEDLDVPVIEYDLARLPAPVRRLREQIIEAASSGDLERLRPIIAANEVPPQFSFGDVQEPIESLRSLSADLEGREILATLIEVLEAGYVHVDAGTPDEMYVWPYFARYPPELLTPAQIVELFKLVYAGDYEDMRAYGHYLSYRVGITPDGRWKFFLADE
jgi:hypothetical protein